ncbi:hypothetical protein GCM10010172_02270 [Paractinoplanes ferrugineus]|uniref:Antitoxin n=1 Tax=Paractinoplanes ferrugineus TaxID=113564 RepID=A0A919J5B5_9ACTN|nr:hypothetical protein [Actinoplanes ferrugineus]GIE13632.1 hypothetical protein Afe05nite_54720 [Actinoplanes ferrugineus]
MARSTPAIGTPRNELAINEARIRLVQLVRLAQLTRQITVLIDRGRPAAAIVPVDLLDARDDAPDTTAASAAGWVRRLEKVRQDLRRQHAVHTAELRQALDEAWRVIDDLRPPGTDRRIDEQRAACAPLRRPAEPPT